MATKSVVTCDWITTKKVSARKTERVKCDQPAPHHVQLPAGRITFAGDLCEFDLRALQQLLADAGLQPATRVDSKSRAAYVAKSGLPFAGTDARPWLIEQGLAGPTGRLSVEAIEAYAQAH